MRIDPTKPVILPALTTPDAAASAGGRGPNRAPLSSEHNALPALELGLELEAVVVDELADGRLLLRIGGSLIEADSPGGISTGQYLRLRVEQLQPQVVLQITETEPSIETEATLLLRQHLSADANSGELLEHLKTLLTAQLETLGEGARGSVILRKLYDAIGLMLADRAPASAEQIEALFQHGGLYYEAKLARAVLDNGHTLGDMADRDLKGLLLAALEESQSTTFGPEIIRTIHAQLNNLETQQAANLLAQSGNGGLLLQVPFFSGASFTTAVLLVEPDGKRSGARDQRQNGYDLLFLLDLENFGRTRIDAHLDDHSLRVIFYVDRDSSVALATESLPAFNEVLLGLGYREVLLAARPLREIPEDKRQKFDALAVGAPASIHLVDMKG